VKNVFPTDLDNVWVYLRKSREDSEAEERARREGREVVETLSRHRRTLLELAHEYRHNITRIFEEVVSGEYIDERPEVQKLLDGVENGEATAVWVMDIDRLGRGDMADQGVVIRTFKESGTLILTPDKVYDLTDEMDEEWTEYKTFMARRELKMIRKRLQNGRIRSVKDGKYIGTRPPFGYDVTRDLTLIPNNDADVVRQIFRMYTEEGLGCNRIAHRLNEMGIKSPMGKIWRGESVLALLNNPVYAGWITWRRLHQDRRRGRYRRRPESEWIKARGQHEPLISEEVFQRSKEIRARRSHVPIRKDRAPSSPLSGLVQCGKCGELMVKRPYARQAAHLICKNPNCDTRSTRLQFVEERIIDELAKWLADYQLSVEEVAASLSPTENKIPLYTKRLNALDAEIARVNAQRDELHNLLEQRIYDTETYLERNQKLHKELTDLKRQREAIEAEMEREEKAMKARLDIIPKVTSVIEAYKATDDVAAKNQLLKSVLEHVVYHKEKWQSGKDFGLELYPMV
jgi:site-specific DNA recombinase